MKARTILVTNLRRLRLERGISQERLAADSGVDRSYLSEIERKMVGPSIDVVSRLADSLGVKLADLFVVPNDSGGKVPSALPTGRRRGRTVV